MIFIAIYFFINIFGFIHLYAADDISQRYDRNDIFLLFIVALVAYLPMALYVVVPALLKEIRDAFKA